MKKSTQGKIHMSLQVDKNDIKVHERILSSRVHLFIWIIINTTKSLLNSFTSFLVAGILITVYIMEVRQFLYILLFFVVYPLSISFEEYFHSITLIAQGNKLNLIGLRIWKLTYRSKINLCTIGMAVGYNILNKKEKIQILANGPILSIFINSIIIILINSIYHMSFQQLFLVFLIFNCISVTSLLPIKYISINGTDALKLLNNKKCLNLSFYELQRIILSGLFDTIFFMFIKKPISKEYLIKTYLTEAFYQYQKKNFSEAKTYLEKVINVDKINAEAYNNIACCLIELDTNLDIAMEYARIATAIAPNDLSYRETLLTVNSILEQKAK